MSRGRLRLVEPCPRRERFSDAVLMSEGLVVLGEESQLLRRKVSVQRRTKGRNKVKCLKKNLCHKANASGVGFEAVSVIYT